MDKIKGVNFGNWLVLEKWMEPDMFAGVEAEDEVWLNRMMEPEPLKERMRLHRETYITEEDFKNVASHGVNLVRIPVPYFIFGDRPPFSGCIEYLDRAFDWAEKWNLQILIDLHTVPGSQNGYDNGGLTGVCKWCRNPKEVEFALTVLERLAKRYGSRNGLFGIQLLNEPISFPVWISSPSFGKAADPAEAKGSWYVPMKFLRKFYIAAYRRLRALLPEEKTIVFHDGFRLMRWNRFFDSQNMKNVMLDTHIYIFAMEKFVPLHFFWVYRIYVGFNKWKLKKVAEHVPVVVGEWCISTRYANDVPAANSDEKKKRFRRVAKLQKKAWNVSAGSIYWNYQLLRDRKAPMDESWKESWDLSRCWANGWMPGKL